jgi:hypothetical protein
VHRVHGRPERPEVGKRIHPHHVARMDDRARLAEQSEARVREPPPAAREVRVAEDGNQGAAGRTPGRKAPSR